MAAAVHGVTPRWITPCQSLSSTLFADIWRTHLPKRSKACCLPACRLVRAGNPSDQVTLRDGTHEYGRRGSRFAVTASSRARRLDPARAPGSREPVDPGRDADDSRCSGPSTSARTCSRWRRPKMRILSRHSRRAVPTRRSAIAIAFARGARTGVRMILMPSVRRASSKLVVNLVSRSRRGT